MPQTPSANCSEVERFEVPITIHPDYDSETLFVEAGGFLSWEERRTGLAAFRENFASGRIKYALFDLRKLTAENDAKDEMEFGKMMVEAIGEFRDIRAAVILSDAFLVSSTVVLRLQKNGFNMLDFRDVSEAKAWLYADQHPEGPTTPPV